MIACHMLYYIYQYAPICSFGDELLIHAFTQWHDHILHVSHAYMLELHTYYARVTHSFAQHAGIYTYSLRIVLDCDLYMCGSATIDIFHNIL